MPSLHFPHPLVLMLLALLGAGVAHAQPMPEEDRAAMEQKVFDALAQSHWVAEGAEDPDRVVYTFTDLKCPFCKRQWESMQPLLADPDNRTQVRHVIVAVLHQDSHPQGAVVLAADDRTAALATGLTEGLTPLGSVPKEVDLQLRENNAMMREFGIRGTPATLFRDPDGNMQFAPGVLQPDTLRELVFQID